MNKLKLGLVFILITAGIVGFIVLEDSPTVVRILSILVGFILAGVVAKFTIQGQEFYTFFRESVEETKKVVWPSRKEALQTSGVVFAFVIAMALFLWFIDAALMSLVKLLMDQNV
ncbi:MAG TPA: preprotein translocase subunit SecE [Nitrosomonas sp.]|nr:preprotein translocase subunit SecE [Nitrosomonas sp.]